jgi:hypothetical protein
MTEADRRAAQERLEALARFDRWAADHPMQLSAAAAIAAAGRLYDLLPPASRQRAIDPSGVIALHRLLASVCRER